MIVAVAYSDARMQALSVRGSDEVRFSSKLKSVRQHLVVVAVVVVQGARSLAKIVDEKEYDQNLHNAIDDRG